MPIETVSPSDLFQYTRNEINDVINDGKILVKDLEKKMSEIKKILLKFSKETLQKLRECLYALGMQLNPVYKSLVIVSIDDRINAL